MSMQIVDSPALPVARRRASLPPRQRAEPFGLRNLVAVFRRRIRLFAALALSVFFAVLVFTALSRPLYTAQAQVMMNTRQQEVMAAPAVLSNLPIESNVVDTEVEVLQSRELARQVAERLQLERDPDFNWALRPPGAIKSFIARVRGRPIPAPQPPTTAEAIEAGRERAASALRGGLRIRRSGLTYVIRISYTTSNPEKAAIIANAYAQQYVLNQVTTKYDATHQATGYLAGQLAQLRGQLQEAEARVERYRSAHNLLSASGATLTEQEISTYNQQLATVRAEQAAADASLRTARNQLARGSNGGDVGEALQSTVVQQLRGQRSATSTRLADLQSRYGPQHPELVSTRQELLAIDEQIQAEIQRVISNLEARAQVARDRTASVASSLGSARGTLAGNNAAGVELGDLERSATAVRTLYEGLLERYQQTNSQSGVEAADSRVLSSAKAPGGPSSPNVPVNLALGFVLAIAVGLAGLVVSELLDDGLTTAEDVESRLGFPALGSVPLLMSLAEPGDRKMQPTAHLLARPLSGFAESFRTLRTSLLYAGQGRPLRVVAVTSALPGEGKTTTAVCVAISAAQAGASVVIVDCDVRRRTVSRLLGVEADHGLLDVLEGKASLDDALCLSPRSGVWVLPLVRREFTPEEIFNTPAMSALLEDLKTRFGLVILDTAPVLAIAETRVIASLADAVVFLTRWRRTPAKATEAALRALEQSEATVAGVVLTQVDVNEQARYGYGDPGYYYAAAKDQYYA